MKPRIKNDSMSKAELDQLKAELFAEMLPVIFHKLKNKLTPILGYAQILLRKIEDKEIAQRLKKIEINANDLAEKLDMLKNYFKIESPPREKLTLNDIINSLQQYFLSIQKTENIQVEFKSDNKLPDDYFIPAQMKLLIINIIDNGVYAIKQKKTSDGKIHIRTELANKAYKLTIRDNGIGIPKEDIPEIWVAFYSKSPDKAGLGLTICEKILSTHKASCQVNSDPGNYTEFIITFSLNPNEIDEADHASHNFDK